MQARAWTRGNACIYLCVYKYASIIYYYIVLFPIFTYKFSNVTPVLRTWSILLVYYIYIHHARDSILTIFSSKIWPIVFHVQHLFVLPRRRLGEILSTPSQKKKYIYISIPRRTRLVSHEVSKLSTDGVLIGDENDAKNGNLSLVLIWHIIIISSMFLYHVWSIKWLLKLGRVSLRFL